MRTYRSATALVLALAFAATACGSSVATPGSSSRASAGSAPPSGQAIAPSAVGSANAADLATFARIEQQVQVMRELSPTKTVTPVLLDSKGLGDWMAQANSTETNHQALADESMLFVHMGLLPAGSSLEQLELALDDSQVVGFYDPTSKGLYVLSGSGSVGPTEKLTFSHEYTHALQDQNFGLDKLATDTADQGDRDLARIALPEGDATLLMTLWSAKYLSVLELMAIAGQSLIGPQSDQLARSPAILRETLMFPYQDGLNFVQSVYDQGGWAAVDKLYSTPPASTSQILHPELYAKGVLPVALTVPAVPSSLPGWKQTMQDTLGELQLRVWLQGGSSALDTATATAAVSTWAGDRVALYDGPNGEWAVVLHTSWRTTAGREAFAQAASDALAGLATQYRVCGQQQDVEIAIASSESLVPEFISCNTIG